jgi:UDP-arabinose 4-epimerase
MLEDYVAAYGVRYVALRYFNACGADPDGELGEWHNPETHLIPKAMLAAKGLAADLPIFGDDYETVDGTCIRDFIHVSDLARAHVLALDHLNRGGDNLAVNIGTGRGTSIREILGAIARVTGRQVPIAMHPRRPGRSAVPFRRSRIRAPDLRLRAGALRSRRDRAHRRAVLRLVELAA